MDNQQRSVTSDERSETIPKGSTSQVNGDGKEEIPTRNMI
jgi:hypothetical protein